MTLIPPPPFVCAFVAQVFTDRACDHALNLLVDQVDPSALERLVPAHLTMKVWKQQYAAAGHFVNPFTNTKTDVANLARNPHLLLPVFSRPAGRPKAKQAAYAKRKQHGKPRNSKQHKPSRKPAGGGAGGGGGGSGAGGGGGGGGGAGDGGAAAAAAAVAAAR